MSLNHWRTRDVQVLHRNPWWVYKRDRVILPSGEDGEYHYVQTPGSVMVIPHDDDGNFILVRQYRYLNRRESLEFPAGGVKRGQSVRDAARAELREEAGFVADRLEEIGGFNPFNGVTDEICRVYLARGLHAVGAQPDVTEEFEMVRHTRPALLAAVLDGSLWDGMTLAALALYDAVQASAGMDQPRAAPWGGSR
ncbi:MAG: NUDIX hydrolase [Bacteroidota bacterium]|jgi:8-oxo-dGTP pyrophosphatase MutT (NUDIX family)|nr:NUDIX hydrolase [Bacteroidota bacterium]